uniref:Uncharacterized protein n=1 Tax=Physcomitrium patens TaxID=3218 RepID=A0A2K1KCW4_PHYPA|nr:hypothetical protein PHYPA_010788 [Physcomitrium patens]
MVSSLLASDLLALDHGFPRDFSLHLLISQGDSIIKGFLTRIYESSRRCTVDIMAASFWLMHAGLLVAQRSSDMVMAWSEPQKSRG